MHVPDSIEALMRIPDKLKIGAHIYTVLRPLSIPQTKEDKEKDRISFGDCAPSELKMRVKKTLPASMAAETFLHEIIHALIDPIGLDDRDDEDVADRVSSGLLQVIRDNNLRFDQD